MAILLLTVTLLFLVSCSGLKKSTTPKPTDPQDSSKVGLVNDIDSLTSSIGNTIGKVGDFFGGLIPGLLAKDSVILIHPRSEIRPSVEIEPQGKWSYPPSPVQRRLEFDSLHRVTLHDDFIGSDINQPQTYSIDNYIQEQREQGLRDGLTKSAINHINVANSGSGNTKSGNQDQGGTGILSDYGHIEIPIPPSIVPTIFGKPSINLRVNGDVAIHLAYRDNQFLQTTGAAFSGSETGLDFRQEVNMNISGSIGDKVKINTDFGSLRQFSFDNLFKLSYQGFPEEIIQSVEAGNVSLITPSKYIGTQSALFGFKGVFRFGPMYLTAIAAQKKGERQSKSFGGGPGSNVSTDFVIQPANFRKNMYFLDTAFIKNYERYYSTIPPTPPQNGNVIVDRSVEVWRMTNNQSTKKTQAYVSYFLTGIPAGNLYPPSAKAIQADRKLFESGYVEKMDTSQYSVNSFTGVITLYQEPSDYDFIAVSYRTPDGLQYGEQVGSGEDTSIVLKLLKPRNLYNNVADKPSWNNLLKNGYYVGATNIDQKNFSVKIAYTFPDGAVYENVRAASGFEKVISVTGLDRYDNATLAAQPDGLFDVVANGAVSPLLDSRTGTLIFPYLEPFGSRILQYQKIQLRKNNKYHPDSTFYFPDIYVQPPQYFTASNYQSAKNSQISINVKYAGGTSTTINLNAFNIVEGSVRVTAAGRTLVEGEDYRIDVNGGTVTLLKPDLATAGAINVEYDTHDIFTTSTKSVLGFRAEVPIIDHGLVGLSLMNYSMRLPSIKTRQGEEPLSNWILGGDASYKVPFPSLTNWLNALPIFNLREKSEVNFKLDAALSLPNPNTQKSPMAVDNNASIAYLDDFEGGRTEFSLNSTYGRWKHSSQPINDNYIGRGLTTDQITARKSKLWWYQPYPNDVRITDIKPNKSVASANEQAQVLDVEFDPTRRAGIYNHNPDLTEAPENTWAGMTQYYQGLNVLATNTDAIEFWMNIKDGRDGGNPQNGVIHFDMGRISEDVIPDGKLETEDKNGNGRYDPGEDIGLDTLSNDQEKAAYPSAANADDPNNDNYSYDQTVSNYDNINGTEGNEQDRSSGYSPDTEDLDNDLNVNLDNNYYEYEIPLDPVNNPYIIGNTNNTWYQFRIPITSFKKIVGSLDSSFSDISYYRLWVSGFSKPLHVRFYDMKLSGSQWTRGKEGLNVSNTISDTSFQVSYVNLEENSGVPTNYTVPPGAQRDRVAGGATTQLANEQSISLQLKCVASNSKREAVKVFPAPNDLFNYRSMAIWAHGDASMPTAVSTISDTANKVWVYFRFGSDKFNYYQYRRPLVKDWQNIHVNFSALSALKATKRVSTDTVTEPANDGVLGSSYTVVGTPNITNAPVFTLGVENQSASSCLTTDVWFDELRLLDANDKTDFAVNGSVQAKLAEFGLVTANFIHENPDFHRVDERFNLNRALTSGWGLTGEFRMEKILPTWLERGSKFPLVISHNETLLSPKYVPNTDVEITSAIAKIQERVGQNGFTAAQAKSMTDSIQRTNETLSVRNSIGATGVQFNFPGSFFLLPAFVNRLVYGFGYGEEFTRTPIYEYYRNWSWTGSILYDLPQLPNVSVSPLTWVSPSTFDIGRYSAYKINFLPQRVTLSASVTRSRLHYLNRTSTLQFFPGSLYQDTLDILNSLVPFINRSMIANRALSFNWKISENGLISPTIDYSLEVANNLTPLETYTVNNRADNSYDSVYYYQQPFKRILSDVFFKDGALVRLGKDFYEQQRLRITTNPRLPWILWIDKFIRPVFSYNVDYKWSNSQTGLQNAKTGQWNNTIVAGLDFNLKEMGLDIFGADAPKAVQRGRTPGKPGGAIENPNQPGAPDPYAQTEQPQNIDPMMGRPNLRRVGDVPGQKPVAPKPPTPLKTDTPKPPSNVPQIGTDTLHHSLGVGAEGERDDLSVSDTILLPIAPVDLPPIDIVEEPPSITARDIAKALIQKPFFDWTGTKFTFTQTNYSLNSALQGNGPGISNFLTKGIFAPETDDNGPSRAYQMGLITDPHGRLLIKFVPKFPFVTFGVRHGLREGSVVPNQTLDINDVFTQKNTLEFQTSRTLWAGASINLNWKTEFTYDERDALRIGSDGSITPLTVQKTGDVSRTFLSIPPLPFLNISQSGIKRVGEKWIEKTAALGATTDIQRDALAPRTKNQLQVESFMQGFETLPFFSGVLREYLPRLNYSFNWSGLEKFPLFSFADRASFRHGYNGNYKRTFKLNPGDSIELSTLQTVVYGFRPLIALDLGWDKVWGGKLSSSLNYDTQTEWASDYSFNRITKRLSTTFGITANFQKQGVTIPFIKLNLKNNFGLSFNFSQTISSDLYYTFNSILTNLGGTSNGGITKTTVEPRFSYDINQQLTIEGFYRYERTTPATSGVLVPPTRTITAGFDIRLKVF